MGTSREPEQAAGCACKLRAGMSDPAGRDSLAFPPVSLLKASALVPGQKPSPGTCSDQEARSLLCVLVPRCHRLYVRQCFKENLILCLFTEKEK